MTYTNLEYMDAFDIAIAIDWLEREARKDERPFIQLPLPVYEERKEPTPETEEKRGVITFDF